MTKCGDCRHWRPWADGQSGECTFAFPPFIKVPAHWCGTKTSRNNGCDLGTPKEEA